MNKTFFYLAVAMLLVMRASGGLAETLEQFEVPSFEAEYKISSRGLTVGKLTRKFQVLPNQTYQFSSETRTTGLASVFSKNQTLEYSEGNIHGSLLMPRIYHYDRKKGGKHKQVKLQFDHDKHELDVEKNGISTRREFSPNAYDKIAYQIQLMADLMSRKSDLFYVVEDDSKSKTYHPNTSTTEKISTPLGVFDTVLVVQKREGEKRQTSFWCAEALGFLPVKVLLVGRDGDKTTATLVSKSGL